MMSFDGKDVKMITKLQHWACLFHRCQTLYDEKVLPSRVDDPCKLKLLAGNCDSPITPYTW